MTLTEAGTNQADFDGETFQSHTRLIVAPASGSFTPAELLAGQGATVSIVRGQVVGAITNSAESISVTSPFTGDVDTVLAWPNERLKKHQHVLSLRVA